MVTGVGFHWGSPRLFLSRLERMACPLSLRLHWLALPPQATRCRPAPGTVLALPAGAPPSGNSRD